MNIPRIFKKEQPPPYFSFIKLMHSKGYELETVYDIGAFRGEWASTFKKAYPKAEVILFEANAAHENFLEKTGLKFFNVVLSGPDRESVSFFNGADSGDSYYKETTTHYDTKPSIQIPCFTLDYMVAEHRLNLPQFIKLDTQGSELDILRGSQKSLERADFIYIECPITIYNKGAPSIEDYLTFFREKHFIPFDIYEVHRSEDTLLQVDIMFLRLSTKERYLGPLKHIRPWG
jgi:FkbM family methyltransferase